LARDAHGIKRVIVPDRNKADLEEVPQEVRDELEFVLVSRLDEVLSARARKAAAAFPGVGRRNGKASGGSAVEPVELS
jgi:ATP-dependent Lon protease